MRLYPPQYYDKIHTENNSFLILIPHSCVVLIYSKISHSYFITDVMHTYILHSLFAALRQNRVPRNISGRSFIFAPKAQKQMNVHKIFSEYDFNAKR
jgi:hypothetical protein